MNPEYDFSNFLDSLKGLSYKEICDRVIIRHQEMVRISNSVRNRKYSRAVKDQAAHLRAQLAGLLFYIDEKRKPGGLSEGDFVRCRNLIDPLILKQS
jgi:hypothetical protein